MSRLNPAFRFLLKTMQQQALPENAEPRLASVVEDLLKLAGVDTLEDLPKAGPLKASGKRGLFNAMFGRDAVRMALDLINDHPQVAKTVIIELSRLQGVSYDKLREEEPGKIIHEYRVLADPIRQILVSRGWRFPYYGSVDATPQYVTLVTHFAKLDMSILDERVKDRAGQTVTISECWLKALEWVTRKMGENSFGFIEYQRQNPSGILNQVWKDSNDSFTDENMMGPNYTCPIAAVEVQGYAYSALINSAELMEHLMKGAAGQTAQKEYQKQIDGLMSKAAKLKQMILTHFYDKAKRYWTSAVYCNEKAKYIHHSSRLSNPGLLLNTRLFDQLEPEYKQPLQDLVRQLISDDMFCAVGIRTRSTLSKAYTPGSYHNGSSWPVDSGVIAQGLRRQGYSALAREIEYRILYGVGQIGWPVEFFRGDSMTKAEVNRQVIFGPNDTVTEQPPQSDQGWTITRVYRIKHELAEDFGERGNYAPVDEFEYTLLMDLAKRSQLKTVKQVDFKAFEDRSARPTA